MPGIVGIVAEAGVEQQQIDLERMVQPLRRASHLCVNQSASDHAGLAGVGLETQGPWLATNHGVTLALAGLVIPGHEPPRPAQAAWLLERFFIGGVEALCGLNGVYTIAIWEEPARRLTVINDRSGYYKLYYWQSPRHLQIASEYKSIASHPQFSKTIDPTTVADIFIHHTSMGGRTLFRDIRAMPPASILTYHDRRLRIEPYWQPVFYQAGSSHASANYGDALAERLGEAVRRRALPATNLLITGGLDSRIVAGLYKKMAPGLSLQTATIGREFGDDMVVGRQLAQVLGYPHAEIPLGETYLIQYAAEAVWKAEGKNGAHASWINAAEPFLIEQNLPFALTGLYGNFVSGRYYPPALYRAQTLDQAAESTRWVTKHDLDAVTGIARPSFLNHPVAESARYMADVFRAAPVPADQPGAFFQRFDYTSLHWRIAFAANTCDALSDAALPLEPFLDVDVIDYILHGMPPDVRANSLFYEEMIVRHLPEVAQVRYGRTGYTVAMDLAVQQNRFLSHLDDYTRRALKRLFPTRFDHERKACIPQAAAMRGGSRLFVEETLDRHNYLEQYFNPPAVRLMLRDHFAGRRNAFMTISGLLTVALWIDQFCG